MKKTILKIILLILPITLLSVYFILNMTTMWFLPKGELISTTMSPNGVYSINCYLVDGGATNGESIRAELVNHEKLLFKKKNIYWQNRTTTGDVEWKSDNVVIINGIELEINHDIYDYRKYID